MCTGDCKAMKNQRNPAIVCCRTVGMILIVLCHIIGYYTFIPGHGFLSLIFNVGVFSFLAISGYLYGAKSIGSFRPWFRKRCVAVLLPASVLIVAVLIAQLCTQRLDSWFSAAVYLLNLQGLGFLYPGFYKVFSEIEVLGSLWFITIIMLCYCMVPFLQKVRDRYADRSSLYILVAAAVCIVFTMVTNVNVIYFLTFAIGYYLSAEKRLQPMRIPGFALLSVLMLVTQVLRLVLRSAYDGTMLYMNYTSISHMTLGIWILCFFFGCGQWFPKLTDKLASHKVVTAANDLSFYVYLTHSCFCRGPLNVYRLFDHLLAATVVFMLATLAASLLLKKIVAFVQNALQK